MTEPTPQKTPPKTAPLNRDDGDDLLAAPAMQGPMLWFALILVPVVLGLFWTLVNGAAKTSDPFPVQAEAPANLDTEQNQSPNVRSVGNNGEEAEAKPAERLGGGGLGGRNRNR